MTINDKVYKLKFGYLAVSASNIMKDVLETAEYLSGLDEEDNLAVYGAITKIMPLVGKMVLAGLQKYHADEFGVDFDDELDVKTKLKTIYDMLDDYFDPENGEREQSAIEMFWNFTNELRDAGFLSGKPQTAAEKIAEIPQDHKKKETNKEQQ